MKSGFRCYICTNFFSWDMLEVLNELNHCSKCKSMVLTAIKKRKELLNSHPEPEQYDKKEEIPVDNWPKVVKKRGKGDKR